MKWVLAFGIAFLLVSEFSYADDSAQKANSPTDTALISGDDQIQSGYKTSAFTAACKRFKSGGETNRPTDRKDRKAYEAYYKTCP